MTYIDSKERLVRAKEVSLIGLIKDLGYTINDSGSTYSMISPFRGENEGSFKIDKRRPTKFRDYGNGKRGDVIDFVQELFSMNRKDAIDYLLKRSNIPLPVYEPIKRDRKSIEILSITDTFSTELRKYLISREISIEVAQKWLKCAVIKFPYSTINPEQEHTVLAWRNDSGGYEFRGGKIKLSNAPKNVTTIKNNGECLYMFEGWPDYLTYLTMIGVMQCDATAIILNSISFLNVIIPFITDKRVLYWGQNDTAGDKALATLKENNIITRDLRFTFKGYKDLNDYWRAKQKKKGFLSEILKF